MSIFNRKVSAALLSAFFVSSSVLAQSTSGSSAPVAELAVKDLRRISYYSAQSLDAMYEFGGNETADGALAALRAKIQRLTDAGHRSGLSTSATAEFFATFVAENSAAPLPESFIGDDGQFDANGLLGSVELYFSKYVPQALDVTAIDEADMAAISSVAQRSTPQLEETQQDAALTVAPAALPELPEIAADAPADVRAILERVALKGEDWVITVQQGDSLALFANALYGDTNLFRKIFEANLEVLVTPNSILVGQELVLPKE